MKINKQKPVMVTGATGYVAGVLVKQLLEAGLTVHAPIRDAQNTDKVQHLKALEEKTAGKIIFFEADLLQKGSYKQAMMGCEIIFHTASPFVVNTKNPQKELIDPAVKGTENILHSASEIISVKRIILTSSCAAIYGDNTDITLTANNRFTESDWNTSSSLQHQAYSYSKTLAEQTAWRIYKQQSHWELIVLNPSGVFGPGIKPHTHSESFNILRQIGDGTMKAGAPKWGMGAVDVRDLAQAHFQAAFLDNASGRYIISGHNTNLFDLARTLTPKYGHRYPIPKRMIPKWLLWLIGPFANKNMTRKMIARNVNISWEGDNSKSVRDLGLNYRPLEQTMTEFFQQLIDHKLL
ncbi:NAD-dependent epimerase/dehydratase family protein [uncultured Shewanella sp.]|uniref:NAD-dependent epimerase/dehydratase family protein n=1 Tax=uncultured Shewanella sp. TaxID=173975 RepID=UPI00260762A9|nr:NAD-dependent epimerase/dehydratase family protein [uncultured Shewanella sp.]